MKKENNDKESSGTKEIFLSVGKYIKSNYQMLIVFVITFLSVATISFLRIATSTTISSYKMEDYERLNFQGN